MSESMLPGKMSDPAELERKQRLKEYRIASRREKRNRKSDEKKQRKLNATILRRMTRNPDKYNKNAARNRVRDIELERRKIWANAVKLAQKLAAVHDPSGTVFNVGPVTTLDDGTVISLEALERRKERQKQRELKELAEARGEAPSVNASNGAANGQDFSASSTGLVNGINPQRMHLFENGGFPSMSKTKQRKLEALAPKPPPPKPVIPEGIPIPSDEEENWLAIWDLPDGEIERRLVRTKKRAAVARKALREKQKEGKAERRAARDEKRKVYRELKETWKTVREEERKLRKAYLTIENEERKRLADQVNIFERQKAMECCAELGFTLDNVEGVNEITPRALGMKGVEVDFEKVEVGDKPSALKSKSTRVNLDVIPDESRAVQLSAHAGDEDELMQDYIEFGAGENQEFEPLNYNHKLRRKLRRAIIAADIKKELLVRERALEHCKANNIEIPDALKTSAKVANQKRPRALENGVLETSKQERVRARVELTEFNNAAKVLRRQAKVRAVEAGLRIFAELTGQIPRVGPYMDNEMH